MRRPTLQSGHIMKFSTLVFDDEKSIFYQFNMNSNEMVKLSGRLFIISIKINDSVQNSKILFFFFVDFFGLMM